jgi:chromate transport protein ChrA
MLEGSKRLRGVLDSLVSEGSISEEQLHLINTRFEALEGSDSRKSIFAEIAAYLGGAFVLIAMLFLAAKSLGDLPRVARVGALSALSIGLLFISHQLGNLNAMRLRLTSVLSMAAAISASGAVAFAFKSNSGAPWITFTVGAFIAVYSFVKYRHEILQIGAYGYLFISGLMILGEVTKIDPIDNFVYAFYWIVLASIWLYLSWTRLIDQTLAYLIAAATYFLATQFLFVTDHRLVSYFVAIVTAPALGWIYLQDRRWPLLLGAVAITTFTTGEFVAATLGGSLGALLGLLSAGIALITSSMLAIRKARNSALPLN